MLDQLFTGLFSTATATISPLHFLLCLGTALVLGALLAVLYHLRNHCTQSFALTLALLPAVVCVVILMVNGNLGAGVAVAGAFSLVRFRSTPGSAKEICVIFLAMASGLACGMGYLGYAALFTVAVALLQLVYEGLGFGRTRTVEKLLRITIPEELDYGDVFTDLFERYTKTSQLVKVKTTGLGSMFRLTYAITLRDAALEKEFIDALRCRNGNLEISCSLRDTDGAAL